MIDKKQLTMDTIPGFLRGQDVDMYAVSVKLTDETSECTADETKITIPLFLDALVTKEIEAYQYKVEAVSSRLVHVLRTNIKKAMPISLFDDEDIDSLSREAIRDLKIQVALGRNIKASATFPHQIGYVKIYKIK